MTQLEPKENVKLIGIDAAKQKFNITIQEGQQTTPLPKKFLISHWRAITGNKWDRYSRKYQNIQPDL